MMIEMSRSYAKGACMKLKQDLQSYEKDDLCKGEAADPHFDPEGGSSTDWWLWRSR
jgi:hypothetical protein